jgi:hypothetical protein
VWLLEFLLTVLAVPLSFWWRLESCARQMEPLDLALFRKGEGQKVNDFCDYLKGERAKIKRSFEKR